MINLARHLLETLLIECNISAANSVRLAQIIVIALFHCLDFQKIRHARHTPNGRENRNEMGRLSSQPPRIKRYKSTISLHISVHPIAFML